jgi:hypothetical protein
MLQRVTDCGCVDVNRIKLAQWWNPLNWDIKPLAPPSSANLSYFKS